MTGIEKAIGFVDARVLRPALANDSGLPKEIKAKVINSRKWVTRFRRVGDLLNYLQRFKSADGDAIYLALKSHGLETYEDIVGEFSEKFSIWSRDATTPGDFVIGHEYDTFQVQIFVGVYSTQAGGMYLLGGPSNPQAVVIKATFDGGMYANAWMKPHERLKYFFKSRNGVFKDTFQENAAILKVEGLPVLTFVRDHRATLSCIAAPSRRRRYIWSRTGRNGLSLFGLTPAPMSRSNNLTSRPALKSR
jgi:5-methylcytosine-specific restriction enzyme A